MSKLSKKNEELIAYLDNLTEDDLLTIIKYGLRNSNAPADITVEDIFNKIGYCYLCKLKWTQINNL